MMVGRGLSLVEVKQFVAEELVMDHWKAQTVEVSLQKAPEAEGMYEKWALDH